MRGGIFIGSPTKLIPVISVAFTVVAAIWDVPVTDGNPFVVHHAGHDAAGSHEDFAPYFVVDLWRSC